MIMQHHICPSFVLTIVGVGKDTFIGQPHGYPQHYLNQVGSANLAEHNALHKCGTFGMKQVLYPNETALSCGVMAYRKQVFTILISAKWLT